MESMAFFFIYTNVLPSKTSCPGYQDCEVLWQEGLNDICRQAFCLALWLCKSRAQLVLAVGNKKPLSAITALGLAPAAFSQASPPL